MSFDNVCMGYIKKENRKTNKKTPFQQLHTRKHVLTHDTWTANDTVLHSTYNSTEEKQLFRVLGGSGNL